MNWLLLEYNDHMMVKIYTDVICRFFLSGVEFYKYGFKQKSTFPNLKEDIVFLVTSVLRLIYILSKNINDF